MLFSRSNGPEGAINTQGWMMSYADMATILLSMFIVLSTLGKDQTGVSLQEATGSFATAQHEFGLAGAFSRSATPVPMRGPTPHYVFSRKDSGPDRSREDAARKRIIDGDEEHLARFLQELQRQFPCRRQARQAGQVIIDLYEPLQKQSPLLAPRHNEVLRQVEPLLHLANYRISLVVWAATPAPTAWARAVDQASRLAGEFAGDAGLDEAAAARLTPLGQPWRYRDVRRPVLSVVVTRLE